MVVVTSLYIGFGVCGYLSFGPETEPIITLNLPGGTENNTQALSFSLLPLIHRIIPIHCERISLFFALFHIPQ